MVNSTQNFKFGLGEKVMVLTLGGERHAEAKVIERIQLPLGKKRWRTPHCKVKLLCCGVTVTATEEELCSTAGKHPSGEY